jgi:hypothetical protein
MSQNDLLKMSEECCICKNCQTSFKGNYCSECGQSKKEFDRPLKLLIVDFVGNIFAFDTRVWRSLKHVLLQPGKMEQQYIQGKRVRYMPPFRMYVFMSFLFFLMLSFMTNRTVQKNKLQHNHINEVKVDDVIVDKDQWELNMPKPSENSMGINDKIQQVVDTPELYISRLFKYFSWAMFFLMPFLGFLLWVFFRHSKKYYLSHFLLSINQHVFLFTLLIIMMLVNLVFPHKTVEPEKYLLFLFPVYAYVGAWGVYRLNWISVLIRLSVVHLIYLILLLLTTAMVAYLVFIR